RRWFLGAALAFLLFIVTMVGLYVYLARAAERELQQAIAEIDEREPDGWRLEEIEARRAGLPAEEKAAPCGVAAKKKMPDPWPTPAAQQNQIVIRVIGVPGMEDEPPSPPRLEPGIPPVNKRIADVPRNMLLDESTLQELRRELDRAFLALAEAH